MVSLTPVLERGTIRAAVLEVAERISSDYGDENKELILIGVLKGAFIFLADLVRNLSFPVKIDFMAVSSYGSETVSSENILLTKKIEIDIKGKHVLVVEDIVDTGLTLSYVVDYLKAFEPASIKVCAMIDKQERRKATVKVDYACHQVAVGFLIGYGLDYAEQYRNLPGLYHLEL